MSSWNHQAFRLPDHVVDRNDRFGVECRAAAKCTDPATHETTYDYTTGRCGRVSDSSKQVCQGHAERFAAKHQVEIQPPRPPAQSAVAAAFAGLTPGVPDRVRVHRTRSLQWYLERRSPRSGPLSVWSSWLGGVPRDGDLDQAISEAELDLAITAMVPTGPWQRGELEAAVEVVEAWRHDDWFFHSWDLAIACDPEGMWRLTRTLDKRFKPIVDNLGNHNMSLERAIKVADELLADGRWLTFGSQWSTFDDGTAEMGAWHPDQAFPERWRSE